MSIETDSAGIKLGTMLDSPADVGTESRSTPSPMASPPPTIPQAPSRNVSFIPAPMMNGNSHSLTTISTSPSTPNGSSKDPASSSTTSLTDQQLPPGCGARQLCKLKRFLATLQQFANDLSPEIGDRDSTWTIEEFHSKLQEATNFPLRPFVIPFLKANLPLLQRELRYCARLANQTPTQYLAQHEQLLLNVNCTSSSDSSEILLKVNGNGKRKTPDRPKENGLARDPQHAEQLSKRPFTLSPGQCFSPSNGSNHQPNGLPHQETRPQHYRLQDMALAHHYRGTYRHQEHRHLQDQHRPAAPGTHRSRQEEVIDHRLTDREWTEEWKHLNNLLNCIMDMVEKTRQSLTVLRRCQEADREQLHHWVLRDSDTDNMRKGVNSMQSQKSASPDHPQLEAAVNEVKRQAMVELKKSVLEAECKANEMITVERVKMERALSEVKQQTSEDARSTSNTQAESSEASRIHSTSWCREDEADGPADVSTIARSTLCSSDRKRSACGARQVASAAPSSESCWNCGRKASETCSGCNAARYCGSFCQHKDWEKHHHVCGQRFLDQPVCSTAASSSSSRQNTAPSKSSRQAQPDTIASSSGPESPIDTGCPTASPPNPIPVEPASH
ncbi:protein CBFA2T1-like isoform X2 [Scyliorhinus torazame]|uniref:protein CBFA2T1-like isoform X2 n=1 Tax=Scyliorhinus torazame TaxID=75743 RepID=UPI003B5AB8CA